MTDIAANREATTVELARQSQALPANPPAARLTRSLFGVCLVLAVLYFTRDLLIPVALAIFLSFLLAPLLRAVQGRGLPRIPAVMVVVSLTVSALALGGWFVGSQAIGLFQELPAYRDNIANKARGLRDSIGMKFRPFTQTIDAVTREISEPAGSPHAEASVVPPLLTPHATQPASNAAASSSGTERLQLLRAAISPLLHPFEVLGLAAVFLVFFLVYREDLRDRIIWLCGRAHLSLTTTALTDAGARVSRYFGGLVLANGLHGLAVTLGLTALGIPNPLVFGVIAALLRFIPFLGPAVAAVLPSTLALALFDGWARPIMVIGLFVLVDVLSANLLEPWLYGARTGASPTAIILSTVLWTWLWGGIGLVLATPITVCLVVLGKYVPQFQALYVLLGDEPVLDPHARLYQRLLAMDRVESLQIINAALKTDPVEKVTSELIVPALSLLADNDEQGPHDESRHAFAAKIIAETLAPESPANTKAESPAVSTTPAETPGPATLLLPVHGPHDGLAAETLARLRESRGSACRVASPHLLFAELLDMIRAEKPAALCLITVRAEQAPRIDLLCKRIAEEAIDCPLVVSIWDPSADAPRLRRRLSWYPGLRLSLTVADTSRAIDAIQPLPPTAPSSSTQPMPAGLRSAPLLAGADA